MNNCLITELKGVVENDNLVKFGQLDILLTGLSNFSIAGKIGTSLSVPSGYKFFQNNTDVGDSVTLNTDQPVIYSIRKADGSQTQDGIVMTIISKYDLTWFRGMYNPAEDSYDVSELEFCTKITNIYLSGPVYIGSITAFSKMTGLDTLNIPSTGITGTLSELATAQVLNGRASGTIGVTSGSDAHANTIRFGSSMEDPTPAETAQGWQIV